MAPDVLTGIFHGCTAQTRAMIDDYLTEKLLDLLVRSVSNIGPHGWQSLLSTLVSPKAQVREGCWDRHVRKAGGSRDIRCRMGVSDATAVTTSPAQEGTGQGDIMQVQAGIVKNLLSSRLLELQRAGGEGSFLFFSPFLFSFLNFTCFRTKPCV